MGKEREEKLAILTGLAGNYSATLAPETSKMWLFLLKDYSAAQVQEAALNVIRKHADVPYRSLPPFAMMQAELDLLDGTVRGEENVALQAEAEWNSLLEEIEGVGSWQIPKLHPVTERVVRMMGGWKVACAWLEKDLIWRHKEFVDLWQQVQGNEEFLAIGAEGVKQLALPAKQRKLNMEALQDYKRMLCAMPENIKQDNDPEPAPPAQEENIQPLPPTEYIPQTPLTPEQSKIRASLVALREKMRGGFNPGEAVA